VPQSDDEANKWYRLAADQGVTGAQIALGRFYALDFLDSYDPIEAFKWFSLANRLGDVDAADKRDFVATRMTPEQLAEANGLITAWVDGHQPLFAEN
jgi:localization factor PodJL